MSPDPASADRPRENAIRPVREDEAEGRVREVYAEIRAAREGDLDDDLSLSKLWLTLGNDPELLSILWRHMDYQYDRGPLPFELASKISLVVATVMDCAGCQFFHESALERAGADADVIEDIGELDFDGAGFSDEERVVLAFAERAARDPHAVTDSDLERLRDLGLTEREILDVIDCVALHVYTAVLQAAAGIVYPGMSREQWAGPP